MKCKQSKKRVRKPTLEEYEKWVSIELTKTCCEICDKHFFWVDSILKLFKEKWEEQERKRK